jgi:hypothetical protein
MRTVTLPDSVADAIESFKKERGRGWSKGLADLLKAEMERGQAKSELKTMLTSIRNKTKLSQKEVYRRLYEGRH